MADKTIDKATQDRMTKLQETLEKFSKKLIDKFEGYINGVALMPPGKNIEQLLDGQEGEVDKDAINVVVLVDDTDSSKLPKHELKAKLDKVIQKMAKDIDKNLKPQTLIYTELWQYCYDGKEEIVEYLASGVPVYDQGMLSAMKLSHVHKSMVLKKFEKYIVSYVLAGSLVQGKATPESDIDVFIVIDDTDVKKMSRSELKDKLRAIIISMGMQASEMTGIKKSFNIQTYILTDFWDSVKEANPVIFTFLRDGVPIYDRGTFMPWKQLLKMGKVKPSMEAIDMYMSSGEQVIERTRMKLKEIGIEDFFWSTIYPSQAAIMLYGLPPPTPKETPVVLREVFVKKEKLLEEKYVKILERNLKVRKDLEHGSVKSITGAQIDKMVTETESFLKRIRKLFSDIEIQQLQKRMADTYDHVVTIVRDILKLEGVKTIAEKDIVKLFDKHIVETGHLPVKVLRSFEQLVKAHKSHNKSELHKAEIDKAITSSQELIRTLVEYIQRKRSVELDRMTIRVKYGKKFGEVILLDKKAFVIHDIDARETISKAAVNAKGGIIGLTDSSLEELEKELVQIKLPQRAFIKDAIFTDLKKIFGRDVEVLLSN